MSAPPRSRLGFLLLVALLFGGLNVFKPLTIDDAAYHYFARQIAARPLDPYGFAVLWYQEPDHANDVLAPPVLPYTWALGVRLFGDDPAACKLLLLPWSFLLVFAVHALLRRFASGLEVPLTVLTVLSPALWPSLNFMLDVPALALGLAAVALFLRACDDGSFWKAACAGLLAGVGCETKYTACTAVAAMVLAALLRRRWALAAAAVLPAAHVFCAWEFITAVLYRRSHFFLRLTGSESTDPRSVSEALQNLVLTKGSLVTSLLSLLGGVTPALLLLGLAASGLRRRWVVFAAAFFLGGLVTVALFDSHLGGSVAPSARLFGPQNPPPLNYELADVIFAVFGGALLILAGVAARALLRPGGGDRSEVVFLLGWLALEVGAYFPLTPFPAVRRVLGVVVVLSLLLGRYAARNLGGVRARQTVWGVVAFGVWLGLALFTLDYREAEVQQRGAEEAARWIRDNGGGRVWYAGHWGFQYYAERNGMQAVIPRYHYDPDSGLPPPTTLEAGDWLVLPDSHIDQQELRLDDMVEVTRLTFDDPVPLRSVVSFYGTPDPVQHLEEPRFQVRIYRARKTFVPEKPPPTPAAEGPPKPSGVP
jgi:hypothetical protein